MGVPWYFHPTLDSAAHSEHPAWVDDQAALVELCRRLRSLTRFAIDTESNSMHAYTERICLIQLTTAGPDGLRDTIVDPLALDLAPLGDILADPSVQKVMHGADYDVLCFKRGHGFSFANLFDTMLAERVLGRSRYGLGALLEEHFGFSTDKSMQRFDWGRRPLPTHAVDYARYDTHFLLALADMQRQALVDADRLEEHTHACERQTRVEPRVRPFDPTAFWKIKGAKGLDAPGPAVLHRLFVLRDAIAREMDRPVFRIAADGTLLELARRRPTDPGALAKALAKARAIHPRVRRSRASAILEAIEAGIADGTAPKAVRPEAPPKDVVTRFDALRAWRKAVAEARGVEPDIVLDKATLMDLARAHPADRAALEATDLLDAWELSRYGDGILACLASSK